MLALSFRSFDFYFNFNLKKIEIYSNVTLFCDASEFWNIRGQTNFKITSYIDN
jgi:hypothetical protein